MHYKVHRYSLSGHLQASDITVFLVGSRRLLLSPGVVCAYSNVSCRPTSQLGSSRSPPGGPPSPSASPRSSSSLKLSFPLALPIPAMRRRRRPVSKQRWCPVAALQGLTSTDSAM